MAGAVSLAWRAFSNGRFFAMVAAATWSFATVVLVVAFSVSGFWFWLLVVDSQTRQSPCLFCFHLVLLLGDRLCREYLEIRSRSLYPLFVCGFS